MVGVERPRQVGDVILDVGSEEVVLLEHGQHDLQHLGGVVLEDAPVGGGGLAAGQFQHHGVDRLFADDVPGDRGDPGRVTAVVEDAAVLLDEVQAGILVGVLGGVVGAQRGDLVAADLVVAVASCLYEADLGSGLFTQLMLSVSYPLGSFSIEFV